MLEPVVLADEDAQQDGVAGNLHGRLLFGG